MKKMIVITVLDLIHLGKKLKCLATKHDWKYVGEKSIQKAEPYAVTYKCQKCGKLTNT